MNSSVREDTEVLDILSKENQRQRDTIILIASENYASKAVLNVQSSVLSNKYAEGYPSRRYYGGCENVDLAEELAISRAKRLFNAEHVNVQPHSGAQANMAAYFALLQPGDRVMGMRLDHGGHLTHGSSVNFSGKLYEFLPYGVDQESEMLDYDSIEKQAKEYMPKLIVAGYTAYSRYIDFARFGEIAMKVNAILMVDMAHISGLVAAGLHPSPVPHARIVTSTTQKTLRGPRGGMILCEKAISRKVDRSVFPNMQGGPFMHTIAAKAVCFWEASQPEFIEYQQNVKSNACVLAASLTDGGLRIVSGGTDNHLMIVDLSALGITGEDAENALAMVGLSANKNTIPNDPRPPRVTSGLRLGTPAITSRGFRTVEVEQVSEMILRTLKANGNQSVLRTVRKQVTELTSRFPAPGIVS